MKIKIGSLGKSETRGLVLATAQLMYWMMMGGNRNNEELFGWGQASVEFAGLDLKIQAKFIKQAEHFLQAFMLIIPSGIRAMLNERFSQIYDQEHNDVHDDGHTNDEILFGGICYALQAEDSEKRGYSYPDSKEMIDLLWPFEEEIKPRESAKRSIEIAGAMLAAEWDRLDRVENQTRLIDRPTGT